ncbi:uncharacterized protein TRIADDRAFT_61448 [Trichoplax adhaerens]|uniref:Death domain-containing protein n=1 Tax=Trichoplax adhaerens TaxID=10228 RepID=B3SB06_TRIAD|nr:predicted protein [Trichoplax adhaerens]EDV20024.1 predicted protein [Trichoplax adhaerens]|eukprot:XP_002117408.1 predicted protein [Trichoplax adhaerens]
MANHRKKREWPEDFQDSQIRIEGKIKKFITTFIQEFNNNLNDLSQVLDRETKYKPEIIRNNAAQIFIDFLTFIRSLPIKTPLVDLGKLTSNIENLILIIKKRYDRKTIKKIINGISPNNDRSALGISMIACDLVRIYEQQLSFISNSSDFYYIKKFAKDMIAAIIVYILDQPDNLPQEADKMAKFISPCIMNPKIVKKNCYNIYCCVVNIYPDAAVESSGITIEEDNSYKYYDLPRQGKNAQYGFRQLSIFRQQDIEKQDAIRCLNDITKQIKSSSQPLYQYQSKLSRNLDMQFFIQYAEQVLDVVKQDEYKISVTIDDDQINAITALITENVFNLISDLLNKLKISLKEVFTNEMVEKITKCLDLITNEEFVLTYSNKQILEHMNQNQETIIKMLNEIFENQNRMQQELDNLNQKRGNGIATLIPSQPKENISQDGDCLDGVVMDRTLEEGEGAQRILDLISKTQILNDIKAVNLKVFYECLGLKHFKVKTILSSNLTIGDRLKNIIKIWCNEKQTEATKRVLVEALSKVGLDKAAELVSKSQK